MNLPYFMLRAFTFPFSLLPIGGIHFCGKALGLLAYYVLTKYRKRTLSNLSLAKNLKVKDLKKTARKSFQNLAITCLEYPKLSRMCDTQKIVKCENPQTAQTLIDQGKGLIFFCGHQANWELLFIEGTQRMPGVAIGRPTKNAALYNWIVSIREKYGGTIISPKQAIKFGLRALKQGKFLGIVGDQGMPESPYAFDFFGRRAWNTPTPAILSYKTRCPIIVATIRRKKKKYLIHYSDPIWPNPKHSLEKEIPRMMKESLYLLEQDIRKCPEQWLWQHNRWKQDLPLNIYHRYRWDSILILVPKEFNFDHLKTFREIYPRAFITALIPQGVSIPLSDVEIITYKDKSALYLKDYRFKLVFNLTSDSKLKKHFLKLSAFAVLDLESLKKAASEHLLEGDSFPLILKKALTRPNTLWKKNAS